MNKKAQFFTLIALGGVLASCGNQAIESKTNTGDVLYEQTTWEWNKLEIGYEAFALLKYSDGSVKKAEASVNSSVIADKTCEKDGILRYTASLTYEGIYLSDSKDEVIKSKGHEYTHYLSDEEFHYHVCDCGQVEVKEAHSYGEEKVVEAPDGWKTPGRKVSVCTVCNHEHFENITSYETYRAEVIARTKETLDAFGELPEGKDAKKMLKEKDVSQIYSYLTREEILSLEEPYLRKLLSVKFDYNKAADVENGGYFAYVNENEETTKTIEQDEEYGALSVINVLKTIENRPESKQKNAFQIYGQSKYRSFFLSTIPSLADKDQEMVVYINAPYAARVGFIGDGTNGVRLLYKNGTPVGTNYFSFDSSKAYEDESKGYVDLVPGWNAVVFNKAAIQDIRNRSLFKFQMEVISEEGIKPGVWKFSSMMTKSLPTYDLYTKMLSLPEIGNVKTSDGFLINETGDSYFSLPKEAERLFLMEDKIIRLKNEWSSFAALPYGNYRLQDDFDSTLYETERGKCFKFEITETTWGKGVLNGKNVTKISCPFSSCGFYIKNYDGKLSLFNPAKSETIVSFNKVPLENGWNLYMLDQTQVDSIRDFDFAASSWNYLYVKYEDKIEPSTIYQSPFYSFDVTSSEYNSIVDLIPEKDSELRYAHKPYIDGAYYLTTLMSSSEIEKCKDYERIVSLHNDFPIKGITFDEIKQKVAMEGCNKYDWNHHNGKAVYFQLLGVGDYTLKLPEVGYQYFDEFMYEGELSQGVIFGFDKDDHYTQSSGGGVNEFFTITFNSGVGGVTSMNIKVYSTDSNPSGNPDNRDYHTYSDVVYDQTRDIVDEDVLSGKKGLDIYVRQQYSWSDKFFIGGAEMEYK
ncbi:MAG: hypothetical protein MJ239_03420 [Bacilli bacterium]|nr:hypothetical protein [Bacilli bacterium]